MCGNKIIVAYCLLFLSQLAWGQSPSPLGRFEVDFVRGCAPLTVTVTNTSGEINDQYFYDTDTCDANSIKYDPAICSSMAPTSSTTFTYNQPGSYSLVQVLTNLVPRTDTLIIEVFETLTPQFEVKLCNNYEVAIDINDSYYQEFQIDYGDGSPPTSNLTHAYPPGTASYPITVSGYFTGGPVNCGDSTATITPQNILPTPTIDEISVTNANQLIGEVTLQYTLDASIDYVLEMATNGSSGYVEMGPVSGNSMSLGSLNTINNFYCFRLVAVDPCNGSRVNSTPVCSISLAAMAMDGRNQLNWNTEIVNFDNFELIKNGGLLALFNTPTLMMEDTLVACNVDYCYQVITNYTNGSRSLSAIQCVTGINTQPPPAINSMTATVSGSSILLDWNLAASSNSSEFSLSRSINHQPFQEIATVNQSQFTDQNLRPQINEHCYMVTYQDLCGNQSGPGITACAIKLLGENINNISFQLTWTAYQGWSNGVSQYQLELLDASGALIGSPLVFDPNTFTYSDPITNNRQVTQYRIVAISNDIIPSRSESNIVISDLPLQVHLPNSFTPNNDGLNDIFLAKGLFIEEFSMEIYSRWGELLFRSEQLEQGWDGRFRGVLVPEGAYVYRILARDPLGRSISKNGAVHVLIKK